jgi:hypothetical protein
VPKHFLLRASPAETDKALLRLYVAYHVLLAQGFTPERIAECLLCSVGVDDGWEEALEWVCRDTMALTIDVVARKRR